jgi:hypothetical protein
MAIEVGTQPVEPNPAPLADAALIDDGWSDEILRRETARRVLQAGNHSGCTDVAAPNYGRPNQTSCLSPGLACHELAASQCCEEQRALLLDSDRVGCRQQFVELHALLYTLHCSVVGYGWAAPGPAVIVPPQVAVPPAPPLGHCYLFGQFDTCADGGCVPTGQSCSICAWLGAFESCGGACIPLGAPCAVGAGANGVTGLCVPDGLSCAGTAFAEEDTCPLVGNYVRCSTTNTACVPAYADAAHGLLRAPLGNGSLSDCCEQAREEALTSCTNSSMASCSPMCKLSTARAEALLPSCGVSRRFPLAPPQNCLFTPGLQWQSRGKMTNLTGVSTENACCRANTPASRASPQISTRSAGEHHMPRLMHSVAAQDSPRVICTHRIRLCVA